MKYVVISNELGSGNSTTGSREREKNAEALSLDELPIATGVAGDALESHRPTRMTLDQYARFVQSMGFTHEQLCAIPVASGGRFTLDD